MVLERIRLGLQCILAGIAFVFCGEILVNLPHEVWIRIVQAANFAAVLIALRQVKLPERRGLNFAAGLVAYVITVVSIAVVGVLAGDAITPVVLFVGLSVVTATLVPWSPWWQLASVALVTVTAMWMVAAILPSPRLFWLQNVGTVVPTLASTVFLCNMLRRQRIALGTAERERQSREDSLRETNRLLEQEIEKHRKTEDALRFAMRELDHRVKNTLATVQSVAEQTVRSARSLPDFSEAFGGRIQAMARIHSALAGRKWDGLTMAELIELVVGPYRHHADSIALDCDATFVDAELVRVLGMTLHELATNAAKYGALSTKDGRVDISCHIESNARRQLRIAWSEHHGPTITEPRRRGFGIRLIEEALAYEAEGTVRIRFPQDGLCCEIEVPMERSAQ